MKPWPSGDDGDVPSSHPISHYPSPNLRLSLFPLSLILFLYTFFPLRLRPIRSLWGLVYLVTSRLIFNLVTLFLQSAPKKTFLRIFVLQINSRCGNVKQCLVKLHSELPGNENERLFFCEIPDLTALNQPVWLQHEFFVIMHLVFVVFCSWGCLKAPARPFRINYFSFPVEQIKGGSEETLVT